MHVAPRADRALQILMFELPVDGAMFALVLAFDCVLWITRGHRMRNPTVPRCADLAHVLWSAIDCPWLVCMDIESTRKERRKERVRAPATIGDAALYQSDGASRCESAARRASYGAAYWRPGQVGAAAATFRQYIGDETNNVAEYHGLKVAMERAVRRPERSVVFQVDSDLVARQMARVDASVCGCRDLLPLHRACVALGERLDEMGTSWEVRHVYREFNQTADMLANLAIDDPGGNGGSRDW